MKKFEYLTRITEGKSLNEYDLNFFGNGGWELVCVIYRPAGLFTHGKFEYVFKRKLANKIF